MRGEKHPGVLEGTHGAVGLRRLLRPRPDVQTRAIQMCAPAPSRCAHPLRADARQRPSRCAPPAHPPRARASPAQMCTRARALQLCLLPQMCRCLAGGKLPAHPELIPSSSRAHPGLIPGRLPAPALQRQGLRVSLCSWQERSRAGTALLFLALPGAYRERPGLLPASLPAAVGCRLAPRCCGFLASPGHGRVKG